MFGWKLIWPQFGWHGYTERKEKLILSEKS